jgi:hypothetical protein
MKSNTTEATDSIATRQFFYTFLSVICNQKYRPEKRSVSKNAKVTERRHYLKIWTTERAEILQNASSSAETTRERRTQADVGLN